MSVKCCLNVEGKVVKSHRTNPNNSAGHGVNQFKVSIEPEPLELRQNIESLELFQIQNLHVGYPYLLNLTNICSQHHQLNIPALTHQTDVHRDQVVPLGAEGDVPDLEPVVHPADQEEAVERDAEVLIIDLRDVFDVNACTVTI